MIPVRRRRGAAAAQFVKRQLTWFRSDPIFRWVDVASGPAAAAAAVAREAALPEAEFHALYLDPADQEAARQVRRVGLYAVPSPDLWTRTSELVVVQVSAVDTRVDSDNFSDFGVG